MNFEQILKDIAAGSAQATPATGSATADYVAALPATFIRLVAGFAGTIS